MTPIALTADLWVLLWTSVATVVLLLLPGLVYAWFLLDEWIDDDDSYAGVMARVDRRDSRTGD